MAKIGDRVRFLNSTGGGIVTRIDGKTAYVEDQDGFESPILLKDIVVVMPVGHETSVKGSNIMFDQKAFDDGRISEDLPVKKSVANTKEDNGFSNKDERLEETSYGDTPNIVLTFEPENVKKLSTTKFAGVLVNDSNYYIDFTFLKRSAEDRGWELVFQGTLNPNELIDVVVITHDILPDYGKISLQGILYKKDKVFHLLPPLNITRKLDLTKFHKLHCFRESKYFETPVLEFPLVTKMPGTDAAEQVFNENLLETYVSNIKNLKKDVDGEENKKVKKATVLSPFKKLPLIEVDLHISQLTDSLVGMEAKDMLGLQLEEVRKTMTAHSKRNGQKIVFIHGKGEGVLRKAVLGLLKKEFPKAELQDASFREYGFGATLVTIH